MSVGRRTTKTNIKAVKDYIIGPIFKISHCRTVVGQGASSAGVTASALPRNACLPPPDREVRHASRGITSFIHGHIIGRGAGVRDISEEISQSRSIEMGMAEGGRVDVGIVEAVRAVGPTDS